MLEKNKFDAIDQFRRLKVLVDGTALAAEFEELDALVQALRFDQVLKRLRASAAPSSAKETP